MVALLIALAFSSAAVHAASPTDPVQEADWQRRNSKAAALKGEARQVQDAADRDYDAKSKACHEKFRVNECRGEAHKEHSQRTSEARRIENEGKALEREVRKEQLADRDARAIADADQKAADLRAREAETTSRRRQADEKAAATLERKEKDAVTGARRHAEAEAKVSRKQAEHAAKVARKKEEAAGKAGDSP